MGRSQPTRTRFFSVAAARLGGHRQDFKMYRQLHEHEGNLNRRTSRLVSRS
jgi:hypothetical protein